MAHHHISNVELALLTTIMTGYARPTFRTGWKACATKFFLPNPWPLAPNPWPLAPDP